MKIIKTFSDYKRLSPLTVILDFTIFISQLQSLFYIQIENDSVLADLVIQAGWMRNKSDSRTNSDCYGIFVICVIVLWLIWLSFLCLDS